MSAHATQSEPHTNPGPQAEDDQFYREILHGLINVGAELTRHLPQQAAAQAQAPQHDPAPQPAPAPSPDAVASVAIAYDRITRAVRRCIALARSLNDPAQPPKHPAPSHTVAPDRTVARKRILRAVEDTLGRQDYDDSYRDCDPTEALHAELLDRMDAPDLDRDIESRPIDDIIKDVLRDLGLAALPGTRPWKRRTPADIAELCARAAAPSCPAGSTPREPGPGPQPPSPGAAQHSPDPQPDQREPGERAEPAATPRGQPGPTHPRPGLPKDPAEAVAFVLRHAADPRWRPPPGG
jgi:hypothetical protein